MGAVTPHKLRSCNKCTKELLCDGCDKLTNKNKEFSANLIEIKRQRPNEKGYMLPKYIST